jgi:hypothetical protein
MDSFDSMLDELTDRRFTVDGGDLIDFLKGIVPDAVENLTDAYTKKKGYLRRAFARLTGGGQTEKAELHTELPEQHEIVYLRRPEPLSERQIEKLLYRRKARHQKEFSRQSNVPELIDRGVTDQGNVRAPLPDPGNIRASLSDAPKLGIVSTGASLIKGHSALVEASVLLSAVQAVGTLARFRDIWDRAVQLVNEFRHDKLENEPGVQRRDDLERLVDQLGNLEFDLAFSVELPLMRVETYHRHLSEVLDVTEQAQRLSAMFTQISGSIRSEITAIDIREARRNDRRARRNDAASMGLAAIAVPLGVLLAFFGINAKEVDKDFYMHDLGHYRWVYITAGTLALVPFLAAIWARLRQHMERKRAERGRW